MKKKMFISAAAAAAVILSGAGANQADASTINVQVKPVVYKVTNQQEAEKLVNQYLAKYNLQSPKQVTNVQKPAAPAQKPAVQKPAAPA
ncbi:hypothetical protein D0463_14620, partial [Bacillus sp. V59.32b]